MFPGRPIDIRLKVLLMISVLVIDDHPIALQGCRRALEDAGIVPIFCATDLEAAYRLLLTHRPDVVIVDLAFPGDSLGGLGFIRRIKASAKQTHVLVLSMHDDPAIVARALEAGASNYVLKDADSEELIKAVRRVSIGTAVYLPGTSLPPALNESRAASRLAADVTRQRSDTFAPYVDRKRSLQTVLSFGEGAW
jgi:two-component system, NarL family, invasion response regulator UvrY